ncbi:hypothetical protein [Hyphomicrobium sp. DY-1]|uniref:hypothetical protein n=1 Tax=Hyphomicrobium sp. DY-1 TaxID=3075650 RepID=UPI0039C405E1
MSPDLADKISNFSGSGHSPQCLTRPVTQPNEPLSQQAYEWRYGKQERGSSCFMQPAETSSPSDFNVRGGGYAVDRSNAIRGTIRTPRRDHQRHTKT